jgi:hypothetical protein
MYHQIRRGFRSPIEFEVRYWSLKELQDTFRVFFSLVDVEVDCFFGIGLQKSDLNLMGKLGKFLTYSSEVLRRGSGYVKFLINFSDSVYIRAKLKL